MSDSEAVRAGSEIVTFYSFKGGTGRTMALANVAWILAANGKRVLVADWDLEAPGLHRFFQPFLDAKVSERPGIVDLIRQYEWRVSKLPPALRVPAGSPELSHLVQELARIESYTVGLNWDFDSGGSLDFLSAGKQNGDYQTTLSSLAWDAFYGKLHGARFLDALRVNLKRRYDYVLIDSRTGLSDVADICTVHMPDTVVDCFTLSTQGIEGAAMIMRMIQAHNERDIRILPVPMRIDPAEKERAQKSLAFAGRKLANLPAGLDERARQDYWASVQVPYEAFYSYEEVLAVFGDVAGSPHSMLSSFERITSHLTGGEVTKLPPMGEALRQRTKARFDRPVPSTSETVTLDYSPEDQLWAEWVEAVLTLGGVPVQPPPEDGAPAGNEPARVLGLITPAYLRRLADQPLTSLPDQAICLTDQRLPYQFSDLPALFLAGLDAELAATLLLDRLGGSRRSGQETAPVRYPGTTQPQVVFLPGRNPNFTGREADLRNLRNRLVESGTAVVLHTPADPAAQVAVTIQGLGGVGKTQVALEYAHRFRADYDVIWWMNCGQAQYVDSALGDLGNQMRNVFNANLPEENVAEAAAQVVAYLQANQAGHRWLLIYDNADDIPEVERFLPKGGGHVLITSRNRGWNKVTTSVPFDVFTREESLRHLRQRVPTISGNEARDVADAVGDLPLAIATAGAYLAETEIAIPDFLDQLDQSPSIVLTLSDLDGRSPQPAADEEQAQPIRGPWSISLDRLQETSPAAAHLLGLCSVMSPDISLKHIINSQAMAAILGRTDSTITDGMAIGRLIQRIDRLALIKLDDRSQQIQVHRLVQAVVRERLGPEGIEQAQREVHQVLVAARPAGEVDSPDTWPQYRAVWLHLTPSRAMWSQEEPVRQLLIDRVRYLRQRSDLERGRRRAAEIESAWQQMLDGQLDGGVRRSLRVQLPRLRFNQANIVRDLAEFETARDIDESVLKEQRELLGEEHPHTLATRGSLAGDLRALGYYDQALIQAQATYDTWAREYGDSHRGTLNAGHNLAVSLRLNGRFQDALDRDLVTYNRVTVALGKDDPRTVDSSLAIARDLLEVGQYAEAASRLKTVVQQRHDRLGEGDRNTLVAQAWLGAATRCAGDPERAEQIITVALDKLILGWGSESTEALACRLNRANNLVGLYHYTEAQKEAEKVSAVYQDRHGATHPQTLICQVCIAIAVCRQGDHRAALEAASHAADGLAQRLGPNHAYALTARMVVAAALAGQQQLTEAIRMEEQIAAALTTAVGRSHPDTLRCQANLLLSRQQTGAAAAAGSRHLVLDQLGKQLGEQHPDVMLATRGERMLRAIDPQPF